MAYRSGQQGPFGVASHTSSTGVEDRPPLSLLLLSVYLFLLPIMGGYLEDPKLSDYPFYNLQLSFLRIFLLIIAGARLWEARQPGGIPWQPRPGWPVVAFFLWTILTAFTGASLLVSYDSLYFLGAGVLTYLLAADAVRHPMGRAWLFAGALAGGAAVGLWGLREYIATVRQSGETTWRIFSTFNGPNLLASYLLPCLFLGLSGILVGKRPWLIAISVATLLCAIGLVLTGSRGAVIIALPLAFLVWATFSHFARDTSDVPRMRGQQLRLGLILLVGLAMGAYFMKPTAARVGGAASGGEANSTQFRILTWRGTLDLIEERPLLGWGPGAWETAYSRVAQAGYTKAAHNSYLQIAAESGIPGLLLWLAVLVYGITGRKRGDMAEPGRLAALVALSLHNAVDYGWLLYAPAGLTWALIGARPPAVQEDAAPLTERKPTPVGIGMGVATAALTALGLLPAYAHWKVLSADTALMSGNPEAALSGYAAASQTDFAEPYWPRRMAEFRRGMGETEEAIALYEEAIRRDPLRATNYYRLGQAYLAAGETEKAEETLKTALRLDPNAVPVLMRLAEIEKERGNEAAALEYYGKVAEIQESPVGTVTALAEMENPDYAEARLELARAALERGDRAEAIEHAEEGLESVNAYITGMEETWGKVLEASGRAAEDVQRQIEEKKELRAGLEETLKLARALPES